MSIAVVRRIFQSALPPHLKATAAVLATFGHEGKGIWASLARVAWMVGKAPRRVNADIARLVALGVLEPVGGRSRGGRGRRSTTEYVIQVDALPTRAAFETNRDASVLVSASKPGRGTAETGTHASVNRDAYVRGSKIFDRSSLIEDPELAEMNAPEAQLARQYERMEDLTKSRRSSRRRRVG